MTWHDAHSWIAAANIGRESYEVPTWSFDCGFKLDFDGPIVRVSSRFYPSRSSADTLKWDGTVSIMVAGADVSEEKFKCGSLDQLRGEVETYIDEQTRMIHERIAAMFKEVGA